MNSYPHKLSLCFTLITITRKASCFGEMHTKRTKNFILKSLSILFICSLYMSMFCTGAVSLLTPDPLDPIEDYKTPGTSKSLEYSTETVNNPDGKWLSAALKDISYYLRNHKFNEWDRRVHREMPTKQEVGYYSSFPEPPLETLYWRVVENCDESFLRCVVYLHSIVFSAPFSGSFENTGENSKDISSKTECRRELIDNMDNGLPFNNPMERFEWRTTASYYMCWYTMKGIPELSMIGESCDNFAECSENVQGFHNRDIRSDDRQSFACALYSFCPDPCCPKKLINNFAECDNEANPCYLHNAEEKPSDRKCKLDRKENQNFRDLILNRWNVSCKCNDKGFKWVSKFGMCVDINECKTGDHTCDSTSEDCMNLPGTFQCVCKWRFHYDEELDKCVPSSNYAMEYKDEACEHEEQNKIFLGKLKYVVYKMFGWDV